MSAVVITVLWVLCMSFFYIFLFSYTIHIKRSKTKQVTLNMNKFIIKNSSTSADKIDSSTTSSSSTQSSVSINTI